MTLAAVSAAMAAVAVSIFTELYPRGMVSSIAAAYDLAVSGSASSPYPMRAMTVVLAAPGAGRPGIEPDGQR